MRISLSSTLLLPVMMSLSACGADSEIARQAPIQFFEGQDDLDDIQWLEGEIYDNRVGFDLCGISALDRNVAFIFGSINVPAGDLRSILLRTDDGGEHWVETLRPVIGSSVWQVSLSGTGEGWALAIWTIESAGTIRLFHTTDNGLSWNDLSEVPKPGLYGVPIEMQFTDNHHGEILIMYDDVLLSEERIAKLHTLDGGLTWQVLNVEVLENGLPANDASPVVTLCNNAASMECELAGADKSQWKAIEGRRGEPHKICRRLGNERGWTVVSTFPTDLNYIDGHLSLP